MTIAIIHLLSAISFTLIIAYVSAQGFWNTVLFWVFPALMGVINAALAWDYIKAFVP